MDKEILIDFITAYSKLLKIISSFINEVYILESNDSEKLKKMSEVLNDEELLISLIKNDSPELSDIYKDLILNLKMATIDKNLLNLSLSEKKDYADKLKLVSENLAKISEQIKTLDLKTTTK